MSQILPRFYQHHQDIGALKRMAPEVQAQPQAFVEMRLPGDPDKLRGIPVVGIHGGAGGHIPGTRPDAVRWPEQNSP